MVKSVCQTAPEFLFWVPTILPRFGYLISLKENSKRTSGNSSNSLGAHSKDLGPASQMLLTGVKLRLGHRLRFRVKRLYDRFTAVVTAWLLMGLPVVTYPLSRGYFLAVCIGVRKVANVASAYLAVVR